MMALTRCLKRFDVYANVILVCALAALLLESKSRWPQVFVSGEERSSEWTPEWRARCAQWDQATQEIAIDLSNREDCGPMRCRMWVAPGAASREKAELGVEVVNGSAETVAFPGSGNFGDHVTFVLRDPKDRPIRMFCYSTLQPYSPHDNRIFDLTFLSGEAKTMEVSGWVAVNHNHEYLAPGTYSLQAVFHDRILVPSSYFFGGMTEPVALCRTISHSNRIPIAVTRGRME
jgi:hypothetical protein